MRIQTKALVIFLFTGLAIPACAQQTTENATQKPSSQIQAAMIGGNASGPADADPNYVIGPQDVLDISVWKEPDVSRVVPVRPDGKISLPLLNDVQAAGLTPLQLASQITAGLTKFMTNPQVTVIISQINSQRIYLLGQVARAGAYLLLPGMTVLQSLSNAGGFTEFANTRRIYVIREQNGKQEKFNFNYKDVVAGKNIAQNIQLKAGDTIFVP